MLETQSGSQESKGKNHHLSKVPFASDPTRPPSIMRPKCSHVSGSSSRVTSYQVTWPDCSCHVCAVRQMLALVARCESAAVAPGRWGPPSSYSASFSLNGECPFCVNELDCTPTNPVLTEHIDYPDVVLSDFHTRKPKEQHSDYSYESNTWERDKGCCDSFVYQNNHPSYRHNQTACDGYDPAGSRSEFLHAQSLACREGVLS